MIFSTRGSSTRLLRMKIPALLVLVACCWGGEGRVIKRPKEDDGALKKIHKHLDQEQKRFVMEHRCRVLASERVVYTEAPRTEALFHCVGSPPVKVTICDDFCHSPCAVGAAPAKKRRRSRAVLKRKRMRDLGTGEHVSLTLPVGCYCKSLKSFTPHRNQFIS